MFNTFFIDIATVKAEATTRPGLPLPPPPPPPSTQPLAWQHDKSLMHREQVDGSTVR